MRNLLFIMEDLQMKKSVRKAIEELCVRTKDIRNGSYKKKNKETVKR